MRYLFSSLTFTWMLSAIAFLGCQSNQTKNPDDNLGTMIHALEKDSVSVFMEKKYIPGFVSTFLDSIQQKRFIVADPDEEWDGTDAIISGDYIDTSTSGAGKKYLYSLTDSSNIKEEGGRIHIKFPDKKLVVFGLGKKVAYISYLTGGIVEEPHFYIFQLKGSKVIAYWQGRPDSSISSNEQARAYVKKMRDVL